MPSPKANPVTSSGVVDHPAQARVHRLEDGGVHHPRAEDLQPAGGLADPAGAGRKAPRPAADDAAEVGFDRRLRVGEVRRAESHRVLLAEEHVQERLDGALQVAEVDAFPHHEPLDLLEHRAVGHVAVAAEHLSRADDPHVGRVRVLQHVVDLRGRGVGAEEQAAAFEVERVLHVARRVVGRHVEGLEVVVVVLHLGPVVDLVAHRHEDVLELLADHGQRVAVPHVGVPARQGGVEAVLAQRVPAALLLEARGERHEPLLDRRLRRVQLLARLPTLGVGQLAERLQEGRERPRLPAEESVAQRLEGRGVVRRGGRGVELRPQRTGLVTDLLDGVGHCPVTLSQREWTASVSEAKRSGFGLTKALRGPGFARRLLPIARLRRSDGPPSRTGPACRRPRCRSRRSPRATCGRARSRRP